MNAAVLSPIEVYVSPALQSSTRKFATRHDSPRASSIRTNPRFATLLQSSSYTRLKSQLPSNHNLANCPGGIAPRLLKTVRMTALLGSEVAQLFSRRCIGRSQEKNVA